MTVPSLKQPRSLFRPSPVVTRFGIKLVSRSFSPLTNLLITVLVHFLFYWRRLPLPRFPCSLIRVLCSPFSRFLDLLDIWVAWGRPFVHHHRKPTLHHHPPPILLSSKTSPISPVVYHFRFLQSDTTLLTSPVFFWKALLFLVTNVSSFGLSFALSVFLSGRSVRHQVLHWTKERKLVS